MSAQTRIAAKQAAEWRLAARKVEAEKAKCSKERDEAHRALNKDQAEYDKQLLALSGAFLALSLAFIKDVVPLQQARYLWELYLSFGLMALCVCLVLASFQLSIRGHFRVMSFWESKEESLSVETPEAQEKYHTGLTALHKRIVAQAQGIRRWNWSSGISFAFGVVFLVIFVISNIHLESRAPVKQVNSQTAPVPQTPAATPPPKATNPVQKTSVK